MDAAIEEWLVVGRAWHFEASQHRGRVKLGNRHWSVIHLLWNCTFSTPELHGKQSLECDSFVMELYILHTRVTCCLHCHVHSQHLSLMLLVSSYLLLLPVDVPVVIWMNLFVWFLLRNQESTFPGS